MTTNIFFANVRKVAALATVFMLFFVAISCDTSKEAYAYDEMKEEETEEVINVSFTEFSLSGTSCMWGHPNHSFQQPLFDRAIIISNNEELQDYIYCIGEVDFPSIDFSNYTLLLATSSAAMGSRTHINGFQRLSANRYKLDIEVVWGDATADGYWVVALITNKLNNQSEIELNVTVIRE